MESKERSGSDAASEDELFIRDRFYCRIREGENTRIGEGQMQKQAWREASSAQSFACWRCLLGTAEVPQDEAGPSYSLASNSIARQSLLVDRSSSRASHKASRDGLRRKEERWAKQ